MPTFYKYMCYFDDFFKSPTIRLSSPIHLNDPFEGRLTATELEQLAKNLTELNPKYNFTPKLVENHYYNNDLKTCGVVSLTTQYDNILMWSLYADEHRGIVLELDEDFLEKETQNPGVRPHYRTPIKLSYYEKREIPLDTKGDFFSLLTYSLIKKNIYWQYEDEWRCIVPLESADRVKFYKGNRKLDYWFNLFTKDPDCIPYVDESEDDNLVNLKLCNAKVEYNELNPTRHNSRYDFCNILVDASKDCLFLKEINPKKIKSIYLGASMEPITIAEIMFTFIDKEEWDHLTVYQLELDLNTYKLNPKKLMENGTFIDLSFKNYLSFIRDNKESDVF